MERNFEIYSVGGEGMSDKYVVVNSLSEYIAAIEENNLFNYISRGESKKYDKPLSSSIQRTLLKNYTEMLEAYHLDVETSINKIQDKNFLAFSQHHGIPTNLLDFSFSPLVSLYFSMDGCQDVGYVHFICKDKTVNINSAVYEHPLGWGMLSDFLDFDKELFEVIMSPMTKAFMKNREGVVEYFEQHVEQLITEYKRGKSDSFLNSLSGGVEKLEEALKIYKQDKAEWIKDVNYKDEDITLQIKRSVSNFLNGFLDLHKDDLSYPTVLVNNYTQANSSRLINIKYSANISVIMFLLKMEEIEYYHEKLCSGKPYYELEFPFYFTYQPPIIDDRVRNQSSIFVFQPYATDRISYNGEETQVWQKIIPDFTIEIHNPNKIRKELDAIGFNLKHIYCDYDSTAKYIIKSMKE